MLPKGHMAMMHSNRCRRGALCEATVPVASRPPRQALWLDSEFEFVYKSVRYCPMAWWTM